MEISIEYQAVRQCLDRLKALSINKIDNQHIPAGIYCLFCALCLLFTHCKKASSNLLKLDKRIISFHANLTAYILSVIVENFFIFGDGKIVPRLKGLFTLANIKTKTWQQ